MPQLFGYAFAALKYIAGVLGPSSGYILAAVLYSSILNAICVKRSLLTQALREREERARPRNRVARLFEKCVFYASIIILSHGFDMISGLGQGVQRATMSILMLDEVLSILTYMSLLDYTRITRWLEEIYVKYVCAEIERTIQEVKPKPAAASPPADKADQF